MIKVLSSVIKWKIDLITSVFTSKYTAIQRPFFASNHTLHDSFLSHVQFHWILNSNCILSYIEITYIDFKCTIFQLHGLAIETGFQIGRPTHLHLWIMRTEALEQEVVFAAHCRNHFGSDVSAGNSKLHRFPWLHPQCAMCRRSTFTAHWQDWTGTCCSCRSPIPKSLRGDRYLTAIAVRAWQIRYILYYIQLWDAEVFEPTNTCIVIVIH